MERITVFSVMAQEHLDTHMQKKKKKNQGTDPTPFTEITSKCILNLNIKAKL